MFTAEQICNIVISPVRTSRFGVTIFYYLMHNLAAGDVDGLTRAVGCPLGGVEGKYCGHVGEFTATVHGSFGLIIGNDLLLGNAQLFSI